MAVLTVFSVAFYAVWNLEHLALLLLSIAVNYAVGRMLGRWPSRLLLGAGIFGNLFFLGYYKYTGLFTTMLHDLGVSEMSFAALVLPLGISFYTFQQIAYLVDCQRQTVGRVGPHQYLLFVLFFPQLIAGPIVHHRELIPQFGRRVPPGTIATHLMVGASIFAIGLFKKVALADSIATFATPVFSAADGGYAVPFLEAWGGALAYTFQIYFDFSGYCDMAIGAAFMLGIRLPLNFDSPYKATSIIDFWRRWHITLSGFLRDHIYVPLGGNRRGMARQCVNVMVVMVVGGLWHGAGYTFIIWGAIHGGFLALNHLLRQTFRGGVLPGPAGRAAGWAATMLIVVCGWVFFRAGTLGGAVRMLEGMAGLNGIAAPQQVRTLLQRVPGMPEIQQAIIYQSSGDVMLLAAMLGIMTVIVTRLPNVAELFAAWRPVLRHGKEAAEPAAAAVPTGWLAGVRRWSFGPGQAVALGLMLFVVARQLLSAAPSEFLYFNF